MRSKEWLTFEEAAKRLGYDPETGRLTWKVLRNTARIGQEAKSLDVCGYIQVNIAGTVVKGHRLAWLLHYGQWPVGYQIDHINGIRDDNRIANLRLVNNQMNSQNQRNGVRPNRTGWMGVHFSENQSKGRQFRAKIQVNEKQIHLGGFPTAESAHAAYVAAKRQFHPGGVL